MTDARGPLTRTIQHAEAFTGALSANSDAIDDFLRSLSALSGTFNRVSERLDSTLAAAEGLVKAVNPDKINNILTNAETVTGNIAKSSDKIDGIMLEVRDAAAGFNKASEEAQSVLKRADQLLAAVDPQKVNTAVDNITSATADARSALSSAREVV